MRLTISFRFALLNPFRITVCIMYRILFLRVSRNKEDDVAEPVTENLPEETNKKQQLDELVCHIDSGTYP